MFAIAFGGLLLWWVGFAVTTELGRRPSRPGEPVVFAIMVAALLVLCLLWNIRSATRMEQSCEICGRRFMAPAEPAENAACPRCRRLSPRLARFRKLQTQFWAFVLRMIAVAWVISAVFYAVNLVTETGWSYWIFVPLVTLVGAVWWLTVFFLPIVLATSARRQGLKYERYTLSLARKTAGTAGATFQSGPITIWASGPSDSVPMLREQLEVVRGRFSSLIGRQIEPRAPLRVYCFDKRDSLELYHRQLSLATGNLGGGYVPAPVRLITLSIEGIVARLIEPERWVRYLSSFYWLELDEGFLPPFWLREAVAHVLAASGEDADFDRLNRRMLGSLRSGNALDAAALFQVQEKALVKPGRSWADHASFTKLSQWSPQSWSLGEYLFGARSTQARRCQAVAFLKDLKSSDRQQDVFMRHFGYTYERLLEDWRSWVLEQENGSHRPPSSRIRDALVHQIIPTIRSSQTNVSERIHAVRIMGAEGYALGADALIELLRTGGAIPREDLVWALEAISGLMLGNNADAWKTWWEGLPVEARGIPEAERIR
jgi:hypothetical protein